MKTITFRPTPDAMKALDYLTGDGDNRSLAINGALVAMWQAQISVKSSIAKSDVQVRDEIATALAKDKVAEVRELTRAEREAKMQAFSLPKGKK